MKTVEVHHDPLCPMFRDAPLLLLGQPCVCGATAEAVQVALDQRPTTPTPTPTPVEDVPAGAPEADLSPVQTETTPTDTWGFDWFLRGDVNEVLATMTERMGDERFDACVTSVPYWGSRRYMPGNENEIGSEDLDVYLDNLAAVFTDVWHLLSDDGMLWLNVGDTAVGSGGAGGDYNKGGGYEGRERYKQGKPITPTGHVLKKGQWANVPSLLSSRLQEEGWLLRSCIVWAKTHPRRESLHHVKRPKLQHEMIYLFSKSRPGETNFDPDGAKYKVPDHWAKYEEGDVWHMDVARGNEANGKAPWPQALVERMLTCMKPNQTETAPTLKGVLLDPFVGGSGNVYHAARKLGWAVVGVDADHEAWKSVEKNCSWVRTETI